MEIQKCDKCKRDLEGYDLLKAKIEQKTKPEIKGIYCKVCLPIIIQQQKLEKAREEVKKINSSPEERKKYSIVKN